MKKIIFLSVILFTISFLMVLTYGKKASFKYDVHELENVTISYDKTIIKCKEKIKNGKLYVDITPIKTGKTSVVIKGDKIVKDNQIEPKQDKINIYVHKFNIITTDRYFGHCKGDEGFIISVYIIILAFHIHLIFKYKQDIKENLYSHKNISNLGLILFTAVVLMWDTFFIIVDYYHGFHKSISLLLVELSDMLPIFILLTLPLAIILTLLVTISNIILVTKEGIRLTNLLGIIFGGFICFSGIIAILFSATGTRGIMADYKSFIRVLLVAYLECVFAGTVISGILAAKQIPKFNKDYIIILGCKIKNDGTLTPLLKGRVDRALDFAQMQKEATGKDITFVPSGGKGSDEIISEAEAIKNYLLKQGVNKNKIIVENKSKNTYENIKFSNKLIKEKNKNANIAFSTTNYHVFRVGSIANSQNIMIEGIGAKTKSYYWINAFIREFVATLVSEKKTHFKTILILSLIILIILITIKIT